jgi:hypothetical protein
VQKQAIGGGVNQVIEGAKFCKKGFCGPLVTDVNGLSLDCSADRLNGFLNSLGIAGGDNHLGALRCRLLGNCQTNSRRTT